jgi:hypothetical protein
MQQAMTPDINVLVAASRADHPNPELPVSDRPTTL